MWIIAISAAVTDLMANDSIALLSRALMHTKLSIDIAARTRSRDVTEQSSLHELSMSSFRTSRALVRAVRRKSGPDLELLQEF